MTLMVSSLTLFQATIILYSMGALLALLLRGRKYSNLLTYLLPAAASLFAIVLSANVIFAKDALHISITRDGLALFGFDVFIDGISAFFILLIGLVSLAVSLYSVGYTKEYEGRKDTSILGFLFNIFILSMLLVVVSNSVFAFLVFWEVMSLTSFFLVIYEHEQEANLKSGMTYIVMTHLGTAFILASFLVMYLQTGSFSFDAFRQYVPFIPLQVKDIVFILAFIGFGTKAGIVPLHIWLPQAHPSAPSNASALMSAVMIKTAIYGLIRVLFDFNSVGSPDSTWWGILLLSTGAITSVIGALYAVIEKDIKRALAFSSIENIGIILTGLGLSVIFASFNLTALAVLALVASMYHTLNHAVFKSLLFMGAGSILYATHTKNMEAMGGLVRKMPWTSLLFLVGALSISGLPPFNGFISEWLTMQSLLSTSQIPDSPLQITIAFASLAFALTAGLAAAAFVKIFGISFLSRGRSEHVLHAVEVPRSMLIGKGVTALAALALGVLPFIGINLITSAFNIQSAQPASPFDTITLQNASGSNFASLSPFTVVVLLASVAVASYGFVRVVGGPTRQVVYETWDCGFGGLDERMEYTATSFSQPIRKIFKAFFRPRNSIQREFYADSNQYMRKTIRMESTTRSLFEERLYTPVVSATIFLFDKIRRIQTGKVNSYLLYILITLVLLLVLVRLSP
ncbi:MAG: hydrogenase 4 subunit B [Thaumarchaeota archaeon RBG_16_49_8]|nr:MAG: hydrogenase 4 subunit B [Thaumarchaeota archaeon RBG_16_49_8]